MLWSVLRLIFKTSSATPYFFYVFNLILSFSTSSQSFKKSVRGKFWGANVLKVRTLFIGHARAKSFSSARTELNINCSNNSSMHKKGVNLSVLECRSPYILQK